MTNLLRLLWLCVVEVLLVACQSAGALPPTATTLRVVQTSLPPAAERTLHPVPSSMPAVPPTPIDCQASAAQPTTQHTVDAEINYREHLVTARQQIRTINRGSEALMQIVFDVEPNRFPGVFQIDSLSTDHGAPSYELTGRRLTVDLDDAFMPGCALTLDLKFTLRVQPIGQEGGYLGYSEHQLNLGQWLPMVAVRRNGEWLIHDVSVIGEQTVADVADWDVTLTVINAPPLVVAAPGTQAEHTENLWRYTLDGARDFTLSLSPQYELLSETNESGVRIELYTFADRTMQTSAGIVDNARQALDAAAQALEMYSDLFGAYPYERFLVVQGDFPDGMEFSGIVFVSDAWFRTNTGSAESYLTIITVHETSHQWWYARVGNDQALDPWLDEALATYSEYIFYEEHYPDLKEWWWNFRVATFVPPDYAGKHVDSSVYEFGTVREYINAVYLRGAHLLDDLRDDLGTEFFFDWLRRYAQEGQERVVTPDVLWSLLTPEQLEQTRETRVEYLRGEQP